MKTKAAVVVLSMIGVLLIGTAIMQASTSSIMYVLCTANTGCHAQDATCTAGTACGTNVEQVHRLTIATADCTGKGPLAKNAGAATCKESSDCWCTKVFWRTTPVCEQTGTVTKITESSVYTTGC